MDVYFIGDKDKQVETLEELTGTSLADGVSFIAEKEKTSSEILTECIYEDFVKSR